MIEPTGLAAAVIDVTHPPASPDQLDAGPASATARLSADHQLETAFVQRIVDRVTAFVARPWFVIMLVPVMLAWIAGNYGARLAGWHALDAPPFNWLQTVVGIVALPIAALILSSQRRQDQLSSHREELALELAILNDQKTSKLIALLEELRRDTPIISDRIDAIAKAMSTPADTQVVIDAIKNPAPFD